MFPVSLTALPLVCIFKSLVWWLLINYWHKRACVRAGSDLAKVFRFNDRSPVDGTRDDSTPAEVGHGSQGINRSSELRVDCKTPVGNRLEWVWINFNSRLIWNLCNCTLYSFLCIGSAERHKVGCPLYIPHNNLLFVVNALNVSSTCHQQHVINNMSSADARFMPWMCHQQHVINKMSSATCHQQMQRLCPERVISNMSSADATFMPWTHHKQHVISRCNVYALNVS